MSNPPSVPTQPLPSVIVHIVEAGEAASQSAAAWSGIPDHTDPGLLDQFIAAYPGSLEAYPAFALRYQLLRTRGSVDEYNRFIALYRYRAGAQQAIYELFDLVDDGGQGQISGYLDFLKRYPESPLARVAELRVHALAFAAAFALDTPDDYDAFLGAFPRAAQVPTVMQLAKSKAIDEATREWTQMQATPPADGFDAWETKRANRLVGDWSATFLDFVQRWGLPPTSNQPNDDTLAAQVQAGKNDPKDLGAKVVTQAQVDRYAAVLGKVYKDTAAAKDFALNSVDRVYWGKILGKLGDIDDTLKADQAQLVSLLKDEFDETRDVIRDGFQQMGSELQGLGQQVDNLDHNLTQGLQGVQDGLAALRNNLGTVQDYIMAIHNDLAQAVVPTLDQINHAIDNTNIQLGTLNNGVWGVRDALYNLNVSVCTGFNNVGSQLSGLQDEVVRGFDRQAEAAASNQGSGGGLMGIVKSVQSGFAQLQDRGGKATAQFRNHLEQSAAHVADQIKHEAAQAASDAKKGISDFGNTLARVWHTLDGNVVVFDFTTPGQFSLNFMADTYYGEVESPLGGKFSLSNINAATPPDLSAQSLLPIAARSLGFDLVKSNNYDTVRKQVFSSASDKVIYFSSKRYVDWAGPETLASYAVEEGLSAGAATEDVSLKVQQQVLLELDDILAWLKKLAQDDLDDVMSCLLESLFTQKPPHVQSPRVSVRFVPVDYTYQLKEGHGVEVLTQFLHLPENPLKPLLDELHLDAIKHGSQELADMISAGASGVGVTVHHSAFVIEWTNPVDKPNWLKSLVNDFDQLAHQIAPENVNSILHGVASGINTAYQTYFAGLDYTSFLQKYVQGAILSQLFSALNLTGSALQALANPPTEVVDLTNTQLAKDLSAWMKSNGLAIGNDGKVAFESLTFDLTTYRIEASISLHHRHVWKLSDLPADYHDFLTAHHLL